MLKTGLLSTVAAVAAIAFCMTAAPQTAMAYESVLAPPATPTTGRAGAPARGASKTQTGEGTYGGVISAPPQNNNPYGAPPADNLYDFVENGGEQTPQSIEEARRKAVEMRKQQALEAQKQNAARIQKQRAEWARMRGEMQKKQQEIMQQARDSGALPYGQ